MARNNQADSASKPLDSQARKKKKRRTITNLLLVLILLIGAGIAAYPAFSEYWNSMHQSRAIMGYAEQRGIRVHLERRAGI